MKKETIQTKFGKAYIDSDGYYRVNNRNNTSVMLHRLIFEDFYGIRIPKGYIIHHKNENKLDNCILNLQLLKRSTHQSYHNTKEKNSMYGKHHLDEAKQKISKANKGENNPMYGFSRPLENSLEVSKKKNNSGYFRVTKRILRNGKPLWIYQYYKDGANKQISSCDINTLKSKVIAKNLEWIKFDKKEVSV